MSSMGEDRSQSPPPPPGLAEIEEATVRAEHARALFDRELDALIADLHDAREALRDSPLPGEGTVDEDDEGAR